MLGALGGSIKAVCRARQTTQVPSKPWLRHVFRLTCSYYTGQRKFCGSVRGLGNLNCTLAGRAQMQGWRGSKQCSLSKELSHLPTVMLLLCSRLFRNLQNGTVVSKKPQMTKTGILRQWDVILRGMVIAVRAGSSFQRQWFLRKSWRTSRSLEGKGCCGGEINVQREQAMERLRIKGAHDILWKLKIFICGWSI